MAMTASPWSTTREERKTKQQLTRSLRPLRAIAAQSLAPAERELQRFALGQISHPVHRNTGNLLGHSRVGWDRPYLKDLAPVDA